MNYCKLIILADLMCLFFRSLSGRLLYGCIRILGRGGSGGRLARFLPEIDPGARSDGRSDRRCTRKSRTDGRLRGTFWCGLNGCLSGLGVRRFLRLVARWCSGSRTSSSPVDIQFIESRSCCGAAWTAIRRRRRRRWNSGSAPGGCAESPATRCRFLRICRVGALLLHGVFLDWFMTAAWSRSFKSTSIGASTETTAGLLRRFRRFGGCATTAVRFEAIKGNAII